jgi:hypothetical protein
MRRLTEDDMIGLEEEIRKRTSRIKLFLGSTRLTSDQAVRIVDAIKENLQMIERIDMEQHKSNHLVRHKPLGYQRKHYPAACVEGCEDG